tara:strand:- start:16 stop:816 length:801 start_codon:yes stop_codon:yes gene_type:complete
MGKGSNSTVTNVQSLPPAVERSLTAAYNQFNPFSAAFGAVSDFNPTAALTETAGLSAGEMSAINAANDRLLNQPSFLSAAQQNLTGLLDPSTNPLIQTQIDNAISGAVNDVSSQYALGGRLGSDSFADSLGQGITNAAAPIIANAQLAGLNAVPGLLSADQSLINQAAQFGGLQRGVEQAEFDALAAQANQQNVLDQNQINALLSAAGMGGGLFGQTTSETGGGPSALSRGLGGAVSGASLGALLPAVGGPVGAAIGGGLGLLGLI